MQRLDPPRRRRALVLSYGVTLAALVVVELVVHGPWPGPPILSAGLLITALAAVAFAAFIGGLGAGLGSAVLLGVFTAHFSSAHRAVVELNGRTLQAGLVMLSIGLVVALVVGLLKRRADQVADAALDAERRHADELLRANRALEQANESLQAFTYLVSHDLKEPVRTTDTLLQFLEQDHGAALNDDARDLLRRARRANERLASLLASLIELSRASRIDLRSVEPVEVAGVLRDDACAVRYQSILAERNARLDVAVDAGARVLATPAALAQVFGNLIANAIRHNPAAAPVVLVRSVASSRDRFVAFLVEDNGPGFPQGFAERFARQEAMPSSTKDGGFGLIIARRAVTLLGGSIRLERSEGLGGAAVRVELPSERDAAPTEAPAAPSASASRRVRSGAGAFSAP